MKMPTEIIAGPFTWRLTDKKKDWKCIAEHTASGVTDVETMTVYIEPSLHEQFKRAIVMHELVHVAVYLSDDAHKMISVEQDQEEVFARLLGPSLLHLLRANPELLAWLTHE